MVTPAPSCEKTVPGHEPATTKPPMPMRAPPIKAETTPRSLVYAPFIVAANAWGATSDSAASTKADVAPAAANILSMIKLENANCRRTMNGSKTQAFCMAKPKATPVAAITTKPSAHALVVRADELDLTAGLLLVSGA